MMSLCECEVKERSVLVRVSHPFLIPRIRSHRMRTKPRAHTAIVHSCVILVNQQSQLCSNGHKCGTYHTLTQQIITTRNMACTLMTGLTKLAQVTSFKYLGWWLSLDNSDTMAVAQNITKASAHLGQLCHLLTQQGASHWAMGLFYKDIVQAILQHGAETWTLTQPLLSMLWSFHHCCAQYLACMVQPPT